MKIINRMNWLSKQLLVIFMFIIPITILLQIFSRAIFNYSFTGAEELARILLVWATFLGGNVAYYEKAMPAFDLLERKSRGKKKQYHQIVLHVFNCIFSLSATVFGLALLTQPIIVHQSSAGLNLPMYLLYAAVPVGMMLITMNSIASLVHLLTNIFKGKATDESKEINQSAL